MQKRVWTVDQIPDQSGRIALVTGANSGIGYETAKALAVKGATMILACRSSSKGEEAAAAILRDHPSAKVETLALDLSSLASVRAFAQRFRSKFSALDLLINNAGVMTPPYAKTEDGFELQLGTNHLGHFALTGLLIDRLLKTDGSRIVTVSSMAHQVGKVDFDDLHREKRYRRMEAYGQSKLANLLFTYELQRRLEQAGSAAIAVAAHPGWTGTNLQRHNRLFEFFNPLLAQKPEMGALPTLYAAVSPDVRGGDYFGPEGFIEMKGYPKKVSSNTRSHDRETAAKLWELSEALVAVRFDFSPV